MNDAHRRSASGEFHAGNLQESVRSNPIIITLFSEAVLWPATGFSTIFG
jgi:hypothetical protein